MGASGGKRYEEFVLESIVDVTHGFVRSVSQELDWSDATLKSYPQLAGVRTRFERTFIFFVLFAAFTVLTNLVTGKVYCYVSFESQLDS